ncbi:MAG: hypothetical protein OXE96_09940 [Gemmatimonadetes bacterium]|nr:hypothetical protein [Gemmatimonadota bacterium]
MSKLVRLTTAVAIAAATFLALPEAGSAQPMRGGTVSPSENWEILLRPRFGFVVPRWDYAEGRRIPQRPVFGFELLMRPKNSWYGVRALLERSSGWNAGDLPEWPDSSPFPGHFESAVGDAVLYPVPGHAVVPYVFGGAGFQAFSVTDEAGILPYSFSGSVRKIAMHGGFGFEVPMDGARAIFEVGDFYGETRDAGKVHNMHVTFMIDFGGLGSLFEDLAEDGSEDR